MIEAWLLASRLLLAGTFGVAGIAKLRDRAGTRSALREFGAPAAFAAPLAFALPLAELAVAGLLLPASSAAAGAVGAAALLAVFTVAIGVNLARGRRPDCNCFGQLHSAPVGWTTLVRNLALAGLAVAVAGAGWSDDGSSAVAWIGRLRGVELAVLAVGGVLVLVLAAAGWMFVHLLRQHGRLLVRLDRIEMALAGAGIEPAEHAGLGLPVGSEAPAFELLDTSGRRVSLSGLLAPSLPLVLLFTDPGCGPCGALAPEVARWQREHADRLTIALPSGGAGSRVRDESNAHGLERVLVDDRLAVYSAQGAAGTPCAVLIGADGRIASSLAAGAGAIAELIERALAGEFEVAEEGLPAGSPTPDVRLTTLSGESIDLARPRGETLILFWNPACGFCQEMLDDLLAWEADPPTGAPTLVVVSAGSAEETTANGFQSMVVLDEGFAVAEAFGAGGTPSAALIDTEGRIASPLAVGSDDVLALVNGRRSALHA